MKYNLLLGLLIGIFLIGIVSAVAPNVTLLTPTNGSVITSQPITITTNISAFNSTYTIANATLYIWNSTGSVIYTEFNDAGTAGSGSQAHGVTLDGTGSVAANESSGVWINVTASSITVSKFTLTKNLNASIVRVYNSLGSVIGSRNISAANNAPLFDDLVLTTGIYKIEFTNVSGGWIHMCPSSPPTLPITSSALKWINGSFNGNPQNGVYLCNLLAINTSGLVPGQISSLSVSNVTTPGRYTWNFLAYHNDSSFGWGLQNWSFDIRQLFNGNIFNSSTYETASENLVANITTSGASAISSANLIYNGTSYSGTVTSLGENNYLLSKQLDINTPLGSKNWLYEVVYADGVRVNTTIGTQSVAGINLSICGAAPQDQAYINFTFKNETIAQEIVKGSISSTWTYWLGTGAVNKTLSYSNVPTNLSYGFCFSPQNRTLNVNPTVTYYNTESPQRTYAPGTISLTNSTTTQVLWLLPTNDGIYVTFQVINAALEALEGVNINISRSGVGLISQTLTDAAGSATFFMSPNFAYVVNAFLTGYPNYATTITPTQTSYTITLGSSTTSTNISNYYQGMYPGFAPNNITLLNQTTYNFQFSLNSTYWNVQNFGFVLYNSTGGTIGSNSSSSNGGIVNFAWNTGNDTSIRMNPYWIVNGSYTNMTPIFWIIEDGSQTQWSIKTFGQDLNRYLRINSTDPNARGIFGMTSTGLNMAIFLFIFLVTGIVSLKFGFDNLSVIVGTMATLTWLFDGLGLITYPSDVTLPLASLLMGIMLIGTIFYEVNR